MVEYVGIVKGCQYLLMQTQPLDGAAERRFLLFSAGLRSAQPSIVFCMTSEKI